MALDGAALHAALLPVLREAGVLALQDYRRGEKTTARVAWKPGGSPVTSADYAVDAFLRARLAAIAPGIAYHSEEDEAGWLGGAAGRTFVIDPIDGTRAFVDGRSDWCIALGLLEAGVPVLGMIFVPAEGLFFHAHQGGGAFLNETPLTAPAPNAALSASGPKPAIEALSRRIDAPLLHAPRVHALAYRLVKPLTGAFDLCLARPGAHDWDILGADCILREAGAGLIDDRGAPPVYTLDGGAHGALVAGSTLVLEKIRPSLLTKAG